MLIPAFSGKRRSLRVLALAALGCMLVCGSVSAQEGGAEDGVMETQAGTRSIEPTNESLDMPEPIGGGPALGGTYYYKSPLEKFGTDLLFGSYALNVLISIAYLAVVYPLANLFGDASLNPVMLWMLVPIAGPFFAQYTDAAKSKPFLRAVLIGDSALQASGLVVGLIGLALSGKRQLHAEASSRVQLRLGVEGAGLAGLTLSVHTL